MAIAATAPRHQQAWGWHVELGIIATSETRSNIGEHRMSMGLRNTR